jgi:hypothetical protein
MVTETYQYLLSLMACPAIWVGSVNPTLRPIDLYYRNYKPSVKLESDSVSIQNSGTVWEKQHEYYPSFEELYIYAYICIVKYMYTFARIQITIHIFISIYRYMFTDVIIIRIY